MITAVRTYLVRVDGWYDSTRILIDLTDTEAAAVAKVAEAVTAASKHGCQPTMRIVPRENLGEFDLEALVETEAE